MRPTFITAEDYLLHQAAESTRRKEKRKKELCQLLKRLRPVRHHISCGELRIVPLDSARFGTMQDLIFDSQPMNLVEKWEHPLIF